MGKSTVSLCVAFQKDKRFQQFFWCFSPICHGLIRKDTFLWRLAQNFLVNIGPVQTTGATVKIPCAAECPREVKWWILVLNSPQQLEIIWSAKSTHNTRSTLLCWQNQMHADNLSGWFVLNLSLFCCETERQYIVKQGLGRQGQGQGLVLQGQGLILPRPRPLNLALRPRPRPRPRPRA